MCYYIRFVIPYIMTCTNREGGVYADKNACTTRSTVIFVIKTRCSGRWKIECDRFISSNRKSLWGSSTNRSGVFSNCVPTIFLCYYHQHLKSIRTYAIRERGSAQPSNINKIQIVQSKSLRRTSKTPFYVFNHTLRYKTLTRHSYSTKQVNTINACSPSSFIIHQSIS